MQHDILEAVKRRKNVSMTDGLSYKLDMATDHQNDTTANMSVDDGTINGTGCCVKHIQCESA